MLKRTRKPYQLSLSLTTVPKVSIIVANYERAQALEETVRSIVIQKYPNLELIIIDNASRDMSVEVIKKYENHIAHWVSEPDKGIYDAFNKGIKMSSGEWIYFIGSGDRLLDDSAIITALSAERDADLIYGNVYFHDYRSVYPGRLSKRRLVDQNICQQSIFYRSRLFEKFGMFEIKYPVLADWVFNMRCFGHKSVRTRFVDEIIAFFEGGGRSATLAWTDVNFLQDKANLIKRYLGVYCWAYFVVKYRLHPRIRRTIYGSQK